MEKVIVFQAVVPLQSDDVTDDLQYGFKFYVVDSTTFNEPEEISSASHHKIKVSIEYELRFNWQLLSEDSEQDTIKILFHFARRYIEQKIKNGTLQEFETLRVTHEQHSEPYCPLDLSCIPNPVGSVYRVDVFDQSSEVNKIVAPLGHPNIMILMARMDDALEREDYSGVLHSSASIFETMAKDIVNTSSIQNQTLKSFFDRYRKDSNLPDEILDYILALYNQRNVTPLAGHGSTQLSTLTAQIAVTLAEMTKAFVRIEYNLRQR